MAEGLKGSLEKLIRNLKGLDFESVKQNSRAREKAKFKRHSQDEKILDEIYENDKLALDLYQKIRSKVRWYKVKADSSRAFLNHLVFFYLKLPFGFIKLFEDS